MTDGPGTVTQGERLRDLGLFNLERHRRREGLSLVKGNKIFSVSAGS